MVMRDYQLGGKALAGSEWLLRNLNSALSPRLESRVIMVHSRVSPKRNVSSLPGGVADQARAAARKFLKRRVTSCGVSASIGTDSSTGAGKSRPLETIRTVRSA